MGNGKDADHRRVAGGGRRRQVRFDLNRIVLAVPHAQSRDEPAAPTKSTDRNRGTRALQLVQNVVHQLGTEIG